MAESRIQVGVARYKDLLLLTRGRMLGKNKEKMLRLKSSRCNQGSVICMVDVSVSAGASVPIPTNLNRDP